MHDENLEVVLVDLHSSLVDAARHLGFIDDVRVKGLSWTNIKDVPRAPGTVFVSPANSLGFMDGGIDYTLSRLMFPEVEGRVRAAIAAGGKLTLLGRPFCPIGEAIMVAASSPDVYMVSAPTMWLPQDVHQTHNAYHAMYAVLRETETNPALVKRIYTSGMCTGCGGMPPLEAIHQMMQAYHDFFAGHAPRHGDTAFIIDEQPDWYENTEFKTIPASQVRLHR